MNNTCKLLTVMTVLGSLGANAMHPQPGAWMRETRAGGQHEDHLAMFAHNPHLDYSTSFFVTELFHGANFDAQVLISANEGTCSLKDLFITEGNVFTVQALVASNMLHGVSGNDVVRCILAVGDGHWSSCDYCETAARFIALVAEQEGSDPMAILAELRQQVAQNPQQHNGLLRRLNDEPFSFRWILRKQGVLPQARP
jgi:hypothetical protein